MSKPKKKNAESVKSSAVQGNFDALFQQAVELHNRGVAGDSAAVQQAYAQLEQLFKSYKGRPLLEAYFGSAMVLVARDKSDTSEKYKWASQGLKHLDQAVAASPRDGVIRQLRGRNAFNLPEQYFQRTQTAIEDYTAVIEQQQRGELQLDAEQYAKIVYELGEAYARIGRNADAANVWRRLETEAGGSTVQPLAAQRLQQVANRPAVESVLSEVSNTVVVDATRAIGTLLVRWAQKELEKEQGKQKKNKAKAKKKK
ncbi:hypothetical protein [Paenibacillus soyae]|uniref:Tetratricopeptide repeat protein n=1 Tax=Paenibacillus soyae TaxID=2969249 RepID=A0A9X2MY66_9BACL|nr:hypothetical protein [Paenibacillus soyae]MCR2808006.1 hypothetical protein [Paenibacillus soyae]